MPLYEYECESCGETFEIMQRFSDEPLTVHQGCGGAVKRLLSPPALQFKGSGWYVTDYARGNGKGAAAEKADSGPSADGDKKADAKPAAKAEPSKSAT